MEEMNFELEDEIDVNSIISRLENIEDRLEAIEVELFDRELGGNNEA